METPTLTIKAKRIITRFDGSSFYISAFSPTKQTIEDVRQADLKGDKVCISLDDEVGLFGNGHVVTVTDVRVSDDGRALAVEATKT